jgi:hypothetical protein
MVISGSCKLVGMFLQGLYEGKYDGVIQEIDAQDMKNMTGKAIFEYAKFNMSGVASVYAKEKVQQENVARFAATGGDASSGSQPEKDGAACQELPLQQPSEHEDETEEEVESNIAQKERLLKEPREEHVRAAMQKQVRFVVRPNTKDGYVALLRESTLIQNRSTLATSAPSPDHWRHGWIYDSGSDMEPNISDSSNGSVWAWPPQPDEPVLKQFMEVAMAEHDRYLASERPWSSSSRTSMPEGRIRHDLHEPGLRGGFGSQPVSAGRV